MSEQQALSFQGPLYEQVHKVLRSRILAGEWEPREPLPGEAMLSRQLGVSVGTVRKAMDQLTRENIVVRERGRGTFVRRGDEWRANSAFRLSDPEGSDIPLEIRLVETAVGAATEREIAALRLRPMYKALPSVRRLRREWSGGGETLCWETITVEEARFPRLAEIMDERAETLFPVYAETFRLNVDRVHWTIGGLGRAGARSTADDAGDDEVLTIQRIAIDARGLPFEVAEQRVAQGRCRVEISR